MSQERGRQGSALVLNSSAKPWLHIFFFFFFFLEDKDSNGKEKKTKTKEKKKEVSSMFQISGEKEAKGKKKGFTSHFTFSSRISTAN